MASVDVTVMGAGIFGLSVAWELLRKGARVRVVDPHGVAAGASGGIVGALAPHVPENWNEKKEMQFQSLVMAEGWWAEIARVGGGRPGYSRAGRLQPLADEAAVALAHARAESAAELWRGEAEWRVVSEVGAWAPVSPTGLWIHDTLSASVNPRLGCEALAAAILQKGGEIVAKGPEEGAVVWACGADGLRALSQKLGGNWGQGIKGQAALLACDACGEPQIFADGVHVVPHEGGLVAVGSTTERDYRDLSTDEKLEDVLVKAREYVPALRSADVVRRWAGLRPRSRTRAPMLGRWPGRAGHFIANGGFKIGFGMAPQVGALLSALVLENEDLIPGEFSLG